MEVLQRSELKPIKRKKTRLFRKGSYNDPPMGLKMIRRDTLGQRIALLEACIETQTMIGAIGRSRLAHAVIMYFLEDLIPAGYIYQEKREGKHSSRFLTTTEKGKEAIYQYRRFWRKLCPSEEDPDS